MRNPVPLCYFAIYAYRRDGLQMTKCNGAPRRCHLIPKQVLKRQGLKGDALWDSRVWVLGCGGITGIGGHHGEFDAARTITLPRQTLPEGLEEFAQEHGLEWWLDREYGPKEAA